MINKNATEELKIMMMSYLLFWDEWVKDESCCLSMENINDINFYLKNNFTKPRTKDFLSYNYKPYIIETKNRKLKSAYPVFKEWLIFKFLCTLINAAKIHGAENFLDRPLVKLNIPQKIKTNLKRFRIKTIHELPQVYTAESLAESPVYENILHFLVLNRTYKIDRGL